MTQTGRKWIEGDASAGLTHLEPIPSYEESIAVPPRLQILAATWGGVTVTREIQSMVGDASDKLPLNMRTIHKVLSPDPAPGVYKTLCVLYRFDDAANGEMHLLTVSENDSPAQFTLTKPTTAGPSTAIPRDSPLRFTTTLAQPPWRSPATPHNSSFNTNTPQVEILAVVHGPQRFETPQVLSELGAFFEGRRGQIRMTNAFFGRDPCPYRRKSWSVFFRFVGPGGLGTGRVQVVTGWEDGALEVPWSRHI